MDFVNVFVTSDLTSSERRICLSWTIEFFKSRLELITGVSTLDQKIWIYKSADAAEREEMTAVGSQTLSAYNIRPHTRIHVDDTNAKSVLRELEAEFSDDTGQHYVMADEKYKQRRESVLKWKKENCYGEFDPHFQTRNPLSAQEIENETRFLKVGQSCEVLNGNTSKSGVIKFVGKIDEIDNGRCIWVGVGLDLPLGKNDGSLKGKRYFDCEKNHGCFVKPSKIRLTHFDPMLSSPNIEDEI
ncbi:hypothetical protein KL921_001800 [Ogataea angusta]|uniref:CAP-Gly domain-containing protein n=1 Tax=Pichia angusta TaxID=870730 RepID=A0AAN6I687_PICAN|nr:uncharacterized protein KL928_001984 [Ogataea angusta]KAG7811534.1 hypothetical protein KL921_001800 [Ogataea angusta]KAG7819310.1 hypothetical protein KL928_001984 [Ogataea angusta]KAG7824091.1 hypothetical protein KL909_002089 [Ogataea angusta]KAG7835337.1 hypothetical protein KL943_002652 [Ogataea angusta]KAG7840237.1 hypothetical protein KL942_002188 [Ogataea angusta]